MHSLEIKKYLTSLSWSHISQNTCVVVSVSPSMTFWPISIAVPSCDFSDTAEYRVSALNIKGERSSFAHVVVKSKFQNVSYMSSLHTFQFPLGDQPKVFAKLWQKLHDFTIKIDWVWRANIDVNQNSSLPHDCCSALCVAVSPQVLLPSMPVLLLTDRGSFSRCEAL